MASNILSQSLELSVRTWGSLLLAAVPMNASDTLPGSTSQTRRLTPRRMQSGIDWKRRASATVFSRSTTKLGLGCRLDGTCRPDSNKITLAIKPQ